MAALSPKIGLIFSSFPKLSNTYCGPTIGPYDLKLIETKLLPSEAHNMAKPQHERYRQYVQDPPAGFP
jgi:hypothetical protein